MLMPSVFAVLPLTTVSKVVACSKGISAGLVPLSILSTKVAARRELAVEHRPPSHVALWSMMSVIAE